MTPPALLARTVSRLEALPGVEVHYQDPETGKIVVVQEAESINLEVEGLKRIKALPDIILAEMVKHWFEEDKEMFEGLPQGLEAMGDKAVDYNRLVPEFLQQAPS